MDSIDDCCSKWKHKRIGVLIENRADIDLRDKDGNIAIHTAARHDQDAVAQMLLAN